VALTSEQLLKCLVPLKLVIVSNGPNSESDAIRKAIHRAFQGGVSSPDAADAYFAEGEDLGVSVLEVDFSLGEADARRVLKDARDSALTTLVVALLHDIPAGHYKAWLGEIDDCAQEEDPEKQVGLLPVIMVDGAWRGAIEGLDYHDLDEYSVRPSHVAAHALALSWRLLGDEDEQLSLFISHAKLDGLPLAHAFRNQLQNMNGMECFYDTKSIPPGSSWKGVLRRGVERSVVVALRTNLFEERAWCVQEMDWAEDFGCPLVIVEARTHLVRAREFLPTGGSPCVHVPDGNLVRILQSALREAMRVRLFARQVQALEVGGEINAASTLRVPRTSLATLGLRCASMAGAGQKATHVMIPEKFREPHRRVAESLVGAYFPGVWLGTPQTLVRELVSKLP